MITEEIINQTYINRIISRDSAIIYKTQEQVVRANFHGTDRLARYLSSMPFDVDGTTHYFSILPYLRFLDIRYRQNMEVRRSLALYNRVIWGVLYNETLPDIRYGLTKDIRKEIRKDLERAIELEEYDKSW
ncbi:hypothetical protein [Phocaeicola sartorii]|uniref:hypothetical protein n=1 Tax=Phocaeicola sartorii TaxID=671267 RepID=UPI0035144A09